MFEIDDEGPSRVLPALMKHRDGSAASRALHRLGYALLASALLLACIDEPGAPSDDGSSDDSEVEFEVLGFQKAASSSGVETRVYSPETTTGTFGGMASADVNRDGADDLFILGHKTRAGSETGAELLLNKGNGLFEDASDWLPPLSLFASGPLFADLDLNGSPDLLVPNASDGSIAVLLNPNFRSFSEVEDGAGFKGDFAPALGAVAADVDGDEDLDIFVLRAASPRNTSSAGVLWLNDGEAHFSDHSDALNDLPVQDATSALFLDVNGDLKLDLFIARSDGVTLLVNQSKSSAQLRFLQGDLGQVPELNGAFAVAAGDLDNDRDFDLLLSGVGGLLANRGVSSDVQDEDNHDAGLDAGAAESPASSDAGVSSERPPAGGARPGPTGFNRIIDNTETSYTLWSKDQGFRGTGNAAFCIADFNNDTYLDVFQGTAPPTPKQPSNDGDAAAESPVPGLYLQIPEGGFANGASLAGLDDVVAARSVLCFDHDNDGDVDILIAPFSGEVQLYVNTLDPAVGPRNYVDVRVLGSDEHPSTVGAVVTIVTGSLVQTRSIGQNYSSANQGPDLLHFGLGSSTVIDSVVIAWPDGAEETVFEDFDVNTTYQFTRQ